MPRPRRFRAHLLTAAMIALIALGVSSPVSAHNSLVSSDPADGATLDVSPVQITWVFENPVPLETLTVTLVDPTGARSEITGSTHGPNGETEVVTPLPVLQPGANSLRWRLVSADGHPITGRVEVTITGSTATTAAAPPTTPTPASPAVTIPATTLPDTVTTPAAGDPASEAGDGAFTTPSALRWILRFASYLAIVAVVGILLVSGTVWGGAVTHPVTRRILGQSLVATAALGVVHLLVVASDISGDAPWSALGSIDAATTTYAGMAFALRVVLSLALWIVLFRYRIAHRDVYWTAVALPALGLLGTWAFAGHSRSMRWPATGVVTDVAHHAAAATWIAGLAIVAWIIIPGLAPDVRTPALQRFSRVAAASVAILAITGLVQTVRLTGNPARLLDGGHGRYLLVKLVALVVMLALANANRQRLSRRADDTGDPHEIGTLRRTVLGEFAIGLAIIAITAALVVSPPATSEGAGASDLPVVNYTM